MSLSLLFVKLIFFARFFFCLIHADFLQRIFFIFKEEIMFYSASNILDSSQWQHPTLRFSSARFLKGLSRHVAVCISEREWLKCAEGKIGVIPFTRTMPPNPISEMIALNAVLASASRFEGPLEWPMFTGPDGKRIIRVHIRCTRKKMCPVSRSPAGKGWLSRRRVDEAWSHGVLTMSLTIRWGRRTRKLGQQLSCDRDVKDRTGN